MSQEDVSIALVKTDLTGVAPSSPSGDHLYLHQMFVLHTTQQPFSKVKCCYSSPFDIGQWTGMIQEFTNGSQ